MKWPLFWIERSGTFEETVSAHLFGTADRCPASPAGTQHCGASLVLKLHTYDGPDSPAFSPLEERMEAYKRLLVCDACGRPVTTEWSFGAGMSALWRRRDGAPTDLRKRPEDFGVGATWECPWLTVLFENTWDDWPAGKAPIEILTPGRGWMPESRASNCTMPNDKRHRCWVLHGEGLGLTANKAGVTCGAGAGSIQCGVWHGWLEGGFLKDNLGE